jgi:hypothetical protein
MKRKHRLVKHFHDQKTEHWKDMEELHRVMHRLPGHLIGVLLELIDCPLSFEEIWNYFRRLPRFEKRTSTAWRRKRFTERIKIDLSNAVRAGVIAERDGKLQLTPAGREMTQHVEESIPFFVDRIVSPKTVSYITIALHILLTAVKLSIGTLSGSAGLLADGIDNGVDTLASISVWFGIKYKKERPVSFLIVGLMLFSVIGIGISSYRKIADPGPVSEGIAALIVSLACGFLMLLLSVYQYVVGRRKSSLAIMCQSVDSRNHFLTSLLVAAGILFSLIAQKYRLFDLYYLDAVASVVIGGLILKSAIELLIELVKPDKGLANISHFIQRGQEKRKRKLVYNWLSSTLCDAPLTRDELKKNFKMEFCAQLPRILQLTGIGFQPKSSDELNELLDFFVKGKKLILINGKYSLSGKN